MLCRTKGLSTLQIRSTHLDVSPLSLMTDIRKGPPPQCMGRGASHIVLQGSGNIFTTTYMAMQSIPTGTLRLSTANISDGTRIQIGSETEIVRAIRRKVLGGSLHAARRNPKASQSTLNDQPKTGSVGHIHWRCHIGNTLHSILYGDIALPCVSPIGPWQLLQLPTDVAPTC